MILLVAGILLVGFAAIGLWFLRIDFRVGASSEHAWVGLIAWSWWAHPVDEYDRDERPVAFWLTALFNLAFYLALLSLGGFLIYLSSVKP